MRSVILCTIIATLTATPTLADFGDIVCSWKAPWREGAGMLFNSQINGVPFDVNGAPFPIEGQISVVPVKNEGKAVVVCCYSAHGDMCDWMRNYVNNVHGLNMGFVVPTTGSGGRSIQPSWNSHPSLRSIKGFLDE